MQDKLTGEAQNPPGRGQNHRCWVTPKDVTGGFIKKKFNRINYYPELNGVDLPKMYYDGGRAKNLRISSVPKV